MANPDQDQINQDSENGDSGNKDIWWIIELDAGDEKGDRGVVVSGCFVSGFKLFQV